MKDKKNFFVDREPRIKLVEKGRHKVDKHRKIIYDMASTLSPDDEAFDEYLEHEQLQQTKNKRRY